jgi:hypothetical protein
VAPAPAGPSLTGSTSGGQSSPGSGSGLGPGFYVEYQAFDQASTSFSGPIKQQLTALHDALVKQVVGGVGFGQIGQALSASVEQTRQAFLARLVAAGTLADNFAQVLQASKLLYQKAEAANSFGQAPVAPAGQQPTSGPVTP